MPKELETKLKREAAANPKIKDKDAYVYGTMRKTGWKPGQDGSGNKPKRGHDRVEVPMRQKGRSR